jgi:E3 ubiquitin-protein ligase DRIP
MISCIHCFVELKYQMFDKSIQSRIHNFDHLCLLITSRPDHNLQDIRTKIFPCKRQKVKAEEVVPSTPLPPKRKERSLSSLVVSAPKVSTHTTFTGKRTKTATRKAVALRGCSFIPEESIKKEEAHNEDNPVSSASTSLHMPAQNECQMWDMGY